LLTVRQTADDLYELQPDGPELSTLVRLCSYDELPSGVQKALAVLKMAEIGWNSPGIGCVVAAGQWWISSDYLVLLARQGDEA
jgi:hypothetical protein